MAIEESKKDSPLPMGGNGKASASNRPGVIETISDKVIPSLNPNTKKRRRLDMYFQSGKRAEELPPTRPPPIDSCKDHASFEHSGDAAIRIQSENNNNFDVPRDSQSIARSTDFHYSHPRPHNACSDFQDPIRNAGRSGSPGVRDQLHYSNRVHVAQEEIYNVSERLKDDIGYSGLHRLCNVPREGAQDVRWQDVREYLSNLATQDSNHIYKVLTSRQRPGYDLTPLHVLLTISPPGDVVEFMIDLCPALLGMNTARNESPLGLACSGIAANNNNVIATLVHAYPGARELLDGEGKTPLLRYLERCETLQLGPDPGVVSLLATGFVVTACDYHSHTPLLELGHVAKKLYHNSSDQQARNLRQSLDAILKVYPRQDDVASLLRDMKSLPAELRIFSFENKTVKLYLNDSMQRAPCTAVLMLDCYVQLVIICSFIILITEKGNGENLGAVILLAFGCAYWIVRRFLSFLTSSNRISWIDIWRLIDLVHIILLMGFLSKGRGVLFQDDTRWRGVLIAIGFIVWLEMIAILRASFRDFAIFVEVSLQIFLRLIAFNVASLIVLVSFATMFYISASDQCQTENEFNFCSISSSMLKAYIYFVGGLEESSFSGLSQQTTILMGIYAFVVAILLLNIIIAIVTEAYCAVSQQAELVFWSHRFDFLLEVDGLINLCTELFAIRNCILHGEAEQTTSEHVFEKRWKDAFFEELTGRGSIKTGRDLMAYFLGIPILCMWFILGLVLLGIPWPRSMRGLIFCPKVQTKKKEQGDAAMADLAVELRELKKYITSIHMMLEQMPNSSKRPTLDTQTIRTNAAAPS